MTNPMWQSARLAC